MILLLYVMILILNDMLWFYDILWIYGMLWFCYFIICHFSVILIYVSLCYDSVMVCCFGDCLIIWWSATIATVGLVSDVLKDQLHKKLYESFLTNQGCNILLVWIVRAFSLSRVHISRNQSEEIVLWKSEQGKHWLG